MYKDKQIIVRMSERQKNELDLIAKSNGYNVSSLVRNLIHEFIRQHSKDIKKDGNK